MSSGFSPAEQGALAAWNAPMPPPGFVEEVLRRREPPRAAFGATGLFALGVAVLASALWLGRAAPGARPIPAGAPALAAPDGGLAGDVGDTSEG